MENNQCRYNEEKMLYGDSRHLYYSSIIPLLQFIIHNLQTLADDTFVITCMEINYNKTKTNPAAK